MCFSIKAVAKYFRREDPPVPGIFGNLANCFGLFPCWLLLVRSVDIRHRRDSFPSVFVLVSRRGLSAEQNTARSHCR